MGILEKLRPTPRWKHADPSVRAAAVYEIGPEEGDALRALAREDADARVRRAAVTRLDEAAVLADVARTDPDEEVRTEAIRGLAGLAAERKSLFVPVRLLCDVDELCHRVADPSRAAMLKAISPEHARKRMAEYSVLNPEHPHLCTIDVTHKSPDESADVILNHVQALSSGKSQND